MVSIYLSKLSGHIASGIVVLSVKVKRMSLELDCYEYLEGKLMDGVR
jgi:hypothetical protein